MKGSELVSGVLLRPEGLRRDGALGRLVELGELLVQGKVRAARVTLYLRQLQVRDDSVITVGILDIYDQHARGRQ